MGLQRVGSLSCAFSRIQAPKPFFVGQTPDTDHKDGSFRRWQFLSFLILPTISLLPLRFFVCIGTMNQVFQFSYLNYIYNLNFQFSTIICIMAFFFMEFTVLIVGDRIFEFQWWKWGKGFCLISVAIISFRVFHKDEIIAFLSKGLYHRPL